MRVLVLLAITVCGMGCSALLGIDDPSPDPGDDAPASDRLVFNLADFRMAQLQSVRLHALLMLADGTMQDGTADARYASDNPAVAMVSTPGQIDAGSQSGMATIRATIGVAQPATVKVMVTAKTCHPVINELQTGSAVSSSDEWIEILNPCITSTDVTGWTLVYRAANTTGTIDSNLMITLTGAMAPGELRLFAGQDFAGTSDDKWLGASGILQQNNGAIAIRSGPKDVGPIVDAVAYGAVSPANPFIEGNPTPAMSNGRSAQRLPFDGHDDDDGAGDFMLLTTTSPRALNAP